MEKESTFNIEKTTVCQKTFDKQRQFYFLSYSFNMRKMMANWITMTTHLPFSFKSASYLKSLEIPEKRLYQ